MRTYPVNLIGLERRRAVVIGGGQVAARKVAGLLEAGAQVTVISPTLSPELEAAAAGGQIVAIERVYADGDLAGAFLVVAATDDPEVNQAVWEEATRRNSLINVVDDPSRSNFLAPAVVRRGEVTVAISTGGASPALARRLREQIETFIGPEYGLLTALLSDLRPEIMARFEGGELRLSAFQRLLDADLLEIIRRDGIEAASQQARRLLDAP